jgi:hypothetical protein
MASGTDMQQTEQSRGLTSLIGTALLLSIGISMAAAVMIIAVGAILLTP